MIQATSIQIAMCIRTVRVSNVQIWTYIGNSNLSKFKIDPLSSEHVASENDITD